MGSDEASLTFSSRMSSAAKETGRSMVRMVNTWVKSKVADLKVNA